MRKIAANYIFPITSKPLKNGIIIVDDDGIITDIIDTKGNLQEIEQLEFYNGILVPGFINTHCHLELSHLKGKIPEHTKLVDFIEQVQQFRSNNTYDNDTLKATEEANNEMVVNGIVAVGDISNTDKSFITKLQSKIKYHTFIEVYGFNINKTDDIFEKTLILLQKAQNQYNLSTSIVPHAPYSVSAKLLKKITEHAYKNNSIISIHNQESKEENNLFINKKGKLYEFLKKLGADFSKWQPTGMNSLPSVLVHFPKPNPAAKTLFVHNTYTSEEDIEQTSKHFENKNIFWTFCPNSNLYIENHLPDIEMFVRKNQNIVIGTDSLASNKTLSILEELKTITNRFPAISLNEMLKWATINGAEALNLDKTSGSFEIGKKPGINLIQNIDFAQMMLTEKSSVRVVV